MCVVKFDMECINNKLCIEGYWLRYKRSIYEKGCRGWWGWRLKKKIVFFFLYCIFLYLVYVNKIIVIIIKF